MTCTDSAVRRTGSRRCERVSDNWGSSGRRFKSCQPDHKKIGSELLRCLEWWIRRSGAWDHFGTTSASTPAHRHQSSMFSAFLRAASAEALKSMGAMVRSWRLHLRTTTDLAELARWINPVVRGWMNYYGQFYRTELFALLRRINTYLVRWARRRFKRLRALKKAQRWWKDLVQRQPGMFAHWVWMAEF